MSVIPGKVAPRSDTATGSDPPAGGGTDTTPRRRGVPDPTRSSATRECRARAGGRRRAMARHDADNAVSPGTPHRVRGRRRPVELAGAPTRSSPCRAVPISSSPSSSRACGAAARGRPAPSTWARHHDSPTLSAKGRGVAHRRRQPRAATPSHPLSQPGRIRASSQRGVEDGKRRRTPSTRSSPTSTAVRSSEVTQCPSQFHDVAGRQHRGMAPPGISSYTRSAVGGTVRWTSAQVGPQHRQTVENRGRLVTEHLLRRGGDDTEHQPVAHVRRFRPGAHIQP